MEKDFDLSMCIVKVDDALQARRIQKLAFKQGFKWLIGGETLRDFVHTYLYFDSEDMSISYSHRFFNDGRFTLTTYSDTIKKTKEIIVDKFISKNEDSVATVFQIYDDPEFTAYSVTVVDAYRTPWVKIMTKEELNQFLIEFAHE